MSNTKTSSPSQQQHEAVPHLRRGKPANRGLAEQVRESRRILIEAARLAEWEAHNVDLKDQARPGYRPLYELQEFAEKMAWVKDLEGDSKHTLLKS